MRKLLLAVTLLLSAPATDACATDLIKDGGFEFPMASLGSASVFQLDQYVGKWKVIGTDGNSQVTIVNGSSTSQGCTFAAHKGQQYLDLTGNNPASGETSGGDGNTGIAQNVATTVGTSYALSFWVGTSSCRGRLSAVEVYINGKLLTSAISPGIATDTQQVWRRFSNTFVADSTVTTIELLDKSNVSPNTGLDDVQLNEVGSTP